MIYSTAAMRSRTHTPGAGYQELIELVSGSSGGSAASVAVSNQSAAVTGAVTVNGTFSGTFDWAALALAINP